MQKADILAHAYVRSCGVWQDLTKDQGSAETLFNGLISLSVYSRVALQNVWEGIAGNRPIFASFASHLGCSPRPAPRDAQNKLEQRRTWLAEQLRKLNITCEALTKLHLTTASLEDLLARLHNLDREILFDLDRQRLTALNLIAEDVLSFCRPADFEDRERHYQTFKSGADKLFKEIKDSPTRFSFESLQAVVKHLQGLVEESFADLERTSVPEIKLELVNDSYTPNRGNQGDEVTLQLQISNRAGCSPASNIELQVGPAKSPFFHAQQDFMPIVDALRGGKTADRHWRLRVTQAAKEQKAFPVTLQARFQNSMGQKVKAPETQFTVKLYAESEFQRIENPYAPHAHGGAVKDSKMFFGRDEFIQQICSALMAPGGTKSILIHGQKRAGKTSVLDHLTRKLSTLECLPVSFSLRSGAFTQTDFLYRILQETRDAVDNEVTKRPGLVPFEMPTLPDFASHPTILFHECLGQFLRKCRATDSWRNIRPVLLIDEFTDIFSEIQQGHVPRDFMKLWKAIIEKGYFSCVLAGKDILPAFKREFPNEFGVIDPKRITYLTERHARELIEIPIGSQRYKSNAVGRILELTAGSPFYTMMFCDKLVEHMNRTRSLVVTEADVEKVKESLVSGHDFLDKVEFDPLYAAGEGKIDTGIEPAEAFSVCAAIAKKSQRGGWCAKTALIDLPYDLEAHLLDLHDRDVLERKGDSYRIKVGLFREWMLVNT
jgi:hypothetical protein